MKLEEGKQYSTIFGNLYYMGIYPDYMCTCDMCGHDCNNPLAFEDTNDGNPKERYLLGSTCVNKFIRN